MNKDSLEIEWEVSDGYVGNCPQSFEVDFSEFDNCASIAEVDTMLAEIIQKEFEENITWKCYSLDDYAQKIFAVIKEQNDE